MDTESSLRSGVIMAGHDKYSQYNLKPKSLAQTLPGALNYLILTLNF